MQTGFFRANIQQLMVNIDTHRSKLQKLVIAGQTLHDIVI